MYSGAKGEGVTYGFEKGFYRVGERKKKKKHKLKRSEYYKNN